MATLSFHAPVAVDRKIRAAAKKRGVKLSRYLLDIAEQAAGGEPVSGLGRELEKLALDGVSYATMAEIHGLTEGNVGARLSRLKQKLITALQPFAHELR